MRVDILSNFREKLFSLFVLITVAGFHSSCSRSYFWFHSFSLLFSCFPLHQCLLCYQYTDIILLECFDDLEGIYKIGRFFLMFSFQHVITLQINHFQLKIKWKLLNCTSKRILKYRNFLCTCLGIQQKLLEQQFVLGKPICYRFMWECRSWKVLTISYDSNKVTCHQSNFTGV